MKNEPLLRRLRMNIIYMRVGRLKLFYCSRQDQYSMFSGGRSNGTRECSLPCKTFFVQIRFLSAGTCSRQQGSLCNDVNGVLYIEALYKSCFMIVGIHSNN